MNENEVWLQVTAGQGPAECAWAVVKVTERILREAGEESLQASTLALEPGTMPGTAVSALLAIRGEKGTTQFALRWKGTVQWIARSPFRPEHKRRNWFVGVEVIAPAEDAAFDPREVRVETMRASGPGGQHVNRTESAVRVTHLPTGLQAAASEERSQHRNRKLALARLQRKLQEKEEGREAARRQSLWRAHHELERGNPVRTFRES